jgi:hypothetical protein
MKKVLYCVALIAVAGLAMGQMYFPTTYSVLRAISATEDTQLTSATQRTAEDGSSTSAVRITRHPIGAIHLRFKGTNAENDTFSWTVWAYKDTSAPAKYVAHGTGVLGATATGTANEFYADTITITAQEWFKTAATADGTPDAIVTGGGIAELVVDTCEHQVWKVIITDIAGGGIETETLGVDYCTYY